MIRIEKLTHYYKKRCALSALDLNIHRGEIFGVLGPNGSGKSTLFRILSTSFPPSSGAVEIDGLNLLKDYESIRFKIGVVFQHPSLDARLTVQENLIHQGNLYGLEGSELKKRSEEMLNRLGLHDRSGEITAKLSGGLKRRTELAKGLLHQPVILILDEPSTGLDPGARIDLWRYLKELRDKQGMTILVTTHLMDEAEHCDRLAILSHGKLIGLGTPAELKKEIGGDVLCLKAKDNAQLAAQIEKKWHLKIWTTDQEIQIEHAQGHRFIPELAEAFPGQIESMTLRKPTLEDVFIHKTGHHFWVDEHEK